MIRAEDTRVGLLAELGAIVGVVGLVTLGLMFAIEVPRGGPYRFGTINDLSGTVFNLAFIPVALRVARDASPSTAVRTATVGAVVAGVAGAVLPLLLVAGAMSFEVQAPLVVACIEVQSLWLIVVGRAMREAPARRRLATVSRVVGTSFFAGSVLFGLGFAAPDGSPLRLATWALGGVVGAVGYLGWPYWFHVVGRALRGETTARTNEALAWTQP